MNLTTHYEEALEVVKTPDKYDNRLVIDAQKVIRFYEAGYNQALEDAAENAKLHYKKELLSSDPKIKGSAVYMKKGPFVDKKSILKLKK